MNALLLHTDVQRFINENLNSDLSRLILKGSPFETVKIQEIVEQIDSKNKARTKLPTWFQTEGIYYPNKLNLSQSSSELTASYKANILNGSSLIDLTSGFGVDSYYFSKRFSEVIACEINRDLVEIVAHNFKRLSCPVVLVSEEGMSYLKKRKTRVDLIYLDPSRRTDTKKKVFLLEDCMPNIVASKSMIFEHTDTIMVKVSPLLDISSAIKKLPEVKEVHCIAVANEVKEVLLILNKHYTGSVHLKTVNIQKEHVQHFEAYFGTNTRADYALPLHYLYEPNAAILKAGLFNEVSSQLNIFKLHNNSHLYTSKTLIDFPGRRFKIISETSYDPKKIRKVISSDKAHIATRNFPDSVATIRKRLKMKEGGDRYLFFTTNLNNRPIVLICEKV